MGARSAPKSTIDPHQDSNKHNYKHITKSVRETQRTEQKKKKGILLQLLMNTDKK